MEPSGSRFFLNLLFGGFHMLEFMRFSAAIMFMSAAFYVFVLTMDKFEKVFLGILLGAS